jgi:hypothetical protein
MFMKPQQLRAKAGIWTETASYTKEVACTGAGGLNSTQARNPDQPTMFMKGQQLSAETGALTEFQVIKNKQVTITRVVQSATQKKILKMKDEPTMCMKTQGHVTLCHSQICDF